MSRFLALFCLGIALGSPTSVRAEEPVTQAEMTTVLRMVEKSMRQVLKLKPMTESSPSPAHTKAPANRSDYVLELKRLVEIARPSFRLNPPKLPFDPRANVPKDGASQALKDLVVGGFLSPVGPIAVGPGETMSLKDFADSIGFFVARIADVTHLPTRKFSPYLQGDDEVNLSPPPRKR